MSGKLGQEFGTDLLSIEPLLHHFETLHASLAHDQELAVDCAGAPQRIGQVGEASRNILARARVKPRNGSTVLAGAGNGLDANTVPFPFAQKILGIERAEIALLDRMGEHRRSERSGIVARRFVATSVE